MTKVIILFCIILSSFSCTKSIERDDPEGIPEIILDPFELRNQDNFKFGYADKRGTINLVTENYYSYNEIAFWSELRDENKINIDNKKLHNDLVQQLKELELSDYHPYVGYLVNSIKSIKISCDKKYRDIEAGKSLNDLFSINGQFIVSNNKKYTFYPEDILEEKNINLENFLFPKTMYFKLKQAPFINDEYTFYLELTDEKENKCVQRLAKLRLKK